MDKEKLSELLKSVGYTDEDFDGDVDWYDVDLHDEEMKIIDTIVHPRYESNFDEDEEEITEDGSLGYLNDEYDDIDELYGVDECDISRKEEIETDSEDDLDNVSHNEENFDEFVELEKIEDSDEDDEGISITVSFSVGDNTDYNLEEDEIEEGELTRIEKRKKDAEKMLSYYLSCKKLDKESELRKKRCQFICAGKVLAAKYCEETYGFINIDEAILDNFPLPKEFTEFYKFDRYENVFLRIADYDEEMAIQVWVWLIEQFSPYVEYDSEIVQSINNYTIAKIDWDSKSTLGEKAYNYALNHSEFFFKVISENIVLFPHYDRYIFTALIRKELDFAKKLLKTLLEDERKKLSEKFDVLDDVKLACEYSGTTDEQELFVYFIIPMLASYENKIVKKKIAEWLNELSEYIYISDDARYPMYSPETVWRMKYRYDEFAPMPYNTEEEYLEAKRIHNESILKTGIAIEEIVEEVNNTLIEIDEYGDYVNAEIDVEPFFFDIAFYEKEHIYNILCEEVLKKNGALERLDGGILVGKISNVNIVELYMLTSTTGLIRHYGQMIAATKELDERAVCCNKINETLIKYVIANVRSAKLMYLQNKAMALGTWYFQNPVLKRAYCVWRDSEIAIREKAKLLYADYLASGEIKSKWVSEQKMFGIIRHYYKDAIYQYRSQWLGDQSLDVFVPSIKVGFEYQGQQHYQPIEHFGGAEQFEKQKQRDNDKKQKCELQDVKLIYWNFDESLDDATFFAKLQAALKT